MFHICGGTGKLYTDKVIVCIFLYPLRKNMEFSDWLLVFVAVFVPPVAVLLKRGLSRDLLYNILLAMFGFFPGLIHALYIISTHQQQIAISKKKKQKKNHNNSVVRDEQEPLFHRTQRYV